MIENGKDTNHRLYAAYQFSDSVKNEVDLLFSNGVMPASIVISSVLFTAYQLLRVK